MLRASPCRLLEGSRQLEQEFAFFATPSGVLHAREPGRLQGGHPHERAPDIWAVRLIVEAALAENLATDGVLGEIGTGERETGTVGS